MRRFTATSRLRRRQTLRRATVIAFDVDAELVSIIGVFYGGQDYGTVLQDESEDGED